MGILRTDRVSGLGGANAISGSVFFGRNGVSATASGNWLTLFSEDDFKFGTGDFTIETWIYYTGTTASSNSGFFQISNTVDGINNASNASDGGLAGDFEGGVIKGIGNGSWFNGTTSVTAYSWIHVAMVRHSGTLQWFVNGTADTSASDSNDYSLTHLAIGGYYTTSYLFSGYISNFRVQKGKAEYTAAFTPPTTRLKKTPETVVLACQSPGNILQEATGKTLSIRRVSTNDAPPQASHFTPNSPVGFSTTTDVGTQFGSTFDGVTTFDSQAYFVPPGGNTRERNRGRGIYGLGGFPSYVKTIDFLTIQSTGNAQVFGDLTEAASFMAAAGSQTRAVFSRRFGSGGGTNTMDFVTIANTANAIDFGDATTTAHAPAGCGNNTRGLFGGGATTNILEFITFATAGNAQDFGDLYSKRDMGACSNSTRGVFAGGGDSPQVDTIQFVTISTTGNGSDFGDLTAATQGLTGSSNSTRGIFAGGYTPTVQNTIQFITIATTGNATDFGDLTFTSFRGASCSSPTRSVIMRGFNPSGQDNRIDFITISTTGNAQDFGDKTGNSSQMSESGTSDSHGGLS